MPHDEILAWEYSCKGVALYPHIGGIGIGTESKGATVPLPYLTKRNNLCGSCFTLTT